MVSAKLIGICLGLTSLVISCATGDPQEEAYYRQQPGEAQPASAAPWPRQIEGETTRIKIYPPTPESWSNQILKQRAAVSVETSSSAQPVYGRIWIESKTEVDSANHLVKFKNVRVTSADFPSNAGLSKTVLDAVRKESNSLLKPVPLDQFKSDLAISRAETQQNNPTLINEPPRILYSDRSPAILILIDGKPALRETQTPGILRVVNTRVLLLLDSATGKYFLHLGNGWMESASAEGPWKKSDNPPSTLKEVENRVADKKDADLLNSPDSPWMAMKPHEKENLPTVYVSTQPAELLQTRGSPSYSSIEGTRLLYAENTNDSIFLNEADQKHYVLISGRWYRAASLQGPWTFISAKKLPTDFAKIPESHRKGKVLASVAGTPQAREAVISNEVPQTAEVNRNAASLDPKFDGAPQFKPIEGTPLRYAVNSVFPVIEVDPHSFYSVRAGVWFSANTPEGPWKVATQVPSVIYTIPPSSPLYYVTSVRIYGSDSESVWVGYTPGYFGSYCCSDGVVVFGTGYYYAPWIGAYWIGAPWTFGFGWTSLGWAYYPWWGPWWANGPVTYYVPYVPVAPGTAIPGIYQGWGKSVVTHSNPPMYNQAYVRHGNQSTTVPWGATAPGSAAPHGEQSRVDAYGGNFGTGPSAQHWGPSTSTHPGAPAGPPAAPAAPAGPGPSAPGGHAGAAGHAFSGGGWGRSH